MSDDAAIDLTLEGEGGRLTGRLSPPLRVRVHGIEAVLVSAAAYNIMTQAAGKSVGHQSRIERDPAVQRFIDERLSTHELSSIREAVARQFGGDRTPSLSGLHRYAMARRQAAGAVAGSRRGRRAVR